MSPSLTRSLASASFAFAALASAAVPPATPTPLQLRWLHSGAPAQGLEVVFHKDGAVLRGKSDEAGRLAALAAFDVAHVVATALDYAVDLGHESVSAGVLQVPEPVHVRGRVSRAKGEGRLGLRVGAGRRWPVMERHRGAERRGDFAPRPGENTVFGIELPPVSMLWFEQPLEDGGGFSTGALSSLNPVQLVAFDAEGGFATIDVPIPADVRPGQVLEAGSLNVEAPLSLDVELDVPRGLSVTALATLHDPKIDPALRAEIGRHLSVLDQFDEEAFEFATGRGPFLLDPHGTTRIPGLPRYAALDLAVFGPLPRMSVRRTVALRGDGPTSLRFSRAELGVEEAALASALQRGRLVLAGTDTPVAGATVVYADYPLRLEARTDVDGRFALPGTGVPRVARWFVDARDSGAPEGYSSTADFPAGSAGGELRLELPRKAAAEPPSAAAAFHALEGGGDCSLDDQYPACQGEIEVSTNQWVLADVAGCVYDQKANTLTATVSAPGRWKFLYSETPFLIGFSEPGDFATPFLTNTVPMAPIAPRTNVFVIFYPPVGNLPVKNLPFQISSWLLDPDSAEGLTPNNDFPQVQINCVNAGPLYFYVRVTEGSYTYWYDGAPVSFGNTIVVTLNRTPNPQLPTGAWRSLASTPHPREGDHARGTDSLGRTADGRLSVH